MKSNTRGSFLYTQLIRLFFLYLLGLLVFFISRIFFIYSYGDKEELLGNKNDLAKALWMGMRVDTQVLMYALILPLLMVLISSLITPGLIKKDAYERMIGKTYVIVLFVFSLLLIGNYFFYQQFKSNFNALIFAFFEDDTKGIVKVIWKQYPVLLISIVLLFYYWILKYLVNKIYSKTFSWPFQSAVLKGIFVFLYLAVFFIFMRGSLGLFPLGERNLIVSEHSFINTIASNGVLSFKYAIKHAKKNKFRIDIPSSMKKYGFVSPEEALSVFLEKKVEHADPDLLFTKTPKDSLLEKNPPNVVFILMESMSDYYLKDHSPSFNLMGELEKQMDSLIVTHRFLPKGPRTIQSLEGLIINNPRMQALAQGIYSKHRFMSSNIKPFKDKGYHTVYATGGELGWRNVGGFFKKQYFDEVQGDFFLEKKYPGAKGADWGIYDEYLFRSVLDQLKEKQNKPQFFFVMTTTNHPPYYVPEGYPAYPLKMPVKVKERIRGSQENAYKNFITFQYANDQLGKFIKGILQSPMAKNTIIVVTGDHTNTEFFNFKDSEKFIERAVPLLVYVPEKYRKKEIDLGQKIAGHKDLFPTLYHLALSDAKYVNAGNPLWNSPSQLFGISLDGLVAFQQGAVWNKDTPRFYKWTNLNYLEMLPKHKADSVFFKMDRKARAYQAAMDYLIQTELMRDSLILAH